MRKIRQYVCERQYIIICIFVLKPQCSVMVCSEFIVLYLKELKGGLGVIPQKIFATISKKSQ